MFALGVCFGFGLFSVDTKKEIPYPSLTSEWANKIKHSYHIIPSSNKCGDLRLFLTCRPSN